MALITPTNPGASGASLATQAANNADQYANTGRERLYVVNASGGSVDITLTATGACSHGFLHDVVFTVPDGATRLLPSVPADRFGSVVDLGYSNTSGVTVGVLA